MRILALIPARSGSKRVPKKNMRMFGGKPLIAWSIETALSTPGICDVLVSTDSDEIREISINAGAKVPWLRPSQLATDEASSVDVAIHALDRYENENGEVGGLLLLQPTSPFRTTEFIKQGIEKYLSSGGDSVIGVSPSRENPSWMVTIEENKMNRLDEKSIAKLNSWGPNNLYVVNGCFYLTNPTTLRTHKSFYSATTVPIICNSIIESLDIDTEADFQLGELYLNQVFRADWNKRFE
jgi:CMP-N,N'-diacetyllegionaminic acid synthase